MSVEAVDAGEFGEAPARSVADEHGDQIDRIGEQGSRDSDDGFLDQLLHAAERAKCTSGMDRADPPWMAGAPGFEEIERLSAAHLADRNAVGPQPQGGAYQVGEGRNAVLGAQRDEIGRSTLQFARVFDQDDAII